MDIVRRYHARFISPLVFILLPLLIFVFHNLPAQKNKDKLLENKQKIESDIEYTNKLLTETKKDKRLSMNQLIILNKKINQREILIGSIHTEIDDIDGRITLSSKETSRLANEVKRLKDEYAKMICYAYKNRNSSTRLMFLLASKDINQAILRLKYLQDYTQNKKKQVEYILGTSTILAEKINELLSIKKGKSSLLKNEESEKSILAKEKEEKNGTVKKLLQKEKELIKTIKQKEKEAGKLKRSIQAIIAEEIKKASESKPVVNNSPTKKNKEETKMSKELGLTDAEQKLSGSFTLNKGKLPWPTEKGIISGTFGEHSHPVLKGIKVKNNGIDISTNSGAKARAVFDGKVTGVISIPGAKKAIIIRHGEYLTVYSNLSEVYVKTGNNVKTKQSIGTIYTDTDESKTELHFEVWYGKIFSDPQGWLQ